MDNLNFSNRERLYDYLAEEIQNRIGGVVSWSFVDSNRIKFIQGEGTIICIVKAPTSQEVEQMGVGNWIDQVLSFSDNYDGSNDNMNEDFEEFMSKKREELRQKLRNGNDDNF